MANLTSMLADKQLEAAALTMFLSKYSIPANSDKIDDVTVAKVAKEIKKLDKEDKKIFILKLSEQSLGEQTLEIQTQVLNALKDLSADAGAADVKTAVQTILASVSTTSAATPAASHESSLKKQYEEKRADLAAKLGSESNIMYHLQGFKDLPLSLRFSEKEWRALKAFVCTLPINDGGICDFENARKKLDKLSTKDLEKLHAKWVKKQDPAAKDQAQAARKKQEDEAKRKEYTKELNQAFNKWMQEPYKYVRRPDGSTAVDVDVERQMISRGVLPDADLRRDFMSCLRDMPETRKPEEPCDDMPSTCCEPYSNEESNFVLENCSSMSEGYKRHFKGGEVGGVLIDDQFNFCDASKQKGKSVKQAAQKSRKSSRGRSSYSMSPSVFDSVSFGGSADSFDINTSPNFLASVERATSSRSIGADGVKNSSRYGSSRFLQDINKPF
jgi:hypothetical protein